MTLDAVDTDVATKEALEAVKTAYAIRSALVSNRNLLNLARTAFSPEEANMSIKQTVETSSNNEVSKDSTPRQGEEAMPKSLKEAYNISDRNTQKKNASEIPSSRGKRRREEPVSEEQNDKDKQNRKNERTTVTPFDYSSTKSMGVFSSSGLSANPFFSGVAASGGLGGPGAKQKRVTASVPGKGGKQSKKITEQPNKGARSDKSFVYRSSGR